MVTMPGWLSLARALASRANRSANAASCADAGRQNLQRHDAVEFFLPRLVDRAHAAPADELDDFKLRKFRRQFLDGRRRETRILRARLRFPWPAPLSSNKQGTDREGRRRPGESRQFWQSFCVFI